ncbi:MAG: pseudaminic acid cytidylyltransferase [Proteobacteria bacterium]|nr:pseudaminic acid cytidylyltransferase [Pseudomonadota bacterium]MBU1388896.1 pseudaminic acid cytidylyltransferase [Pseudomonadota bacterium]MBU1543448.1 pseudaminic acid cytidylyltransferase [Pseudomonadota bacterium]MBU2430961.1 pseudaminic acid cytidylyltransferase [Pseudomonadota bacterium]MBU2480781.1 pseudaminic acid cytidylyltransferase [Pseudomonadota bacterium]
MTGADKNIKTLAIIPARGGSKRIPGKNIRLFCGKPIIAYSILAAQKANIFDRIIVSTDDEKIANTAMEWGAQVPFKRPQNLADDYTTTIDVIKHAIQWCNDNNEHYDYTCCIYATAPFIRDQDLKKGYELLVNSPNNFAFPVTGFASSIFRALKLTKENQMKMFWPEHIDTRTQDLPEAYHDVGQFYWGKTNAFLKSRSIFEDQSCPIVIPRYLAQDIDTYEDWDQAELFYKLLFPKSCG